MIKKATFASYIPKHHIPYSYHTQLIYFSKLRHHYLQIKYLFYHTKSNKIWLINPQIDLLINHVNMVLVYAIRLMHNSMRKNLWKITSLFIFFSRNVQHNLFFFLYFLVSIANATAFIHQSVLLYRYMTHSHYYSTK